MNSIGNDNYRPNLKPNAPIKASNGWLSSNMAQLMVFVNGLILTITAFATLNIFIGQIINERLNNLTIEVEGQILSHHAEMETSLNALSSIVTMSSDVTAEKLSQYFSKSVSGAGYFNQIYWIKEVDEGQWSALSLLRGGDFINMFGSSQAFLDYVQKETAETDKSIYTLMSLPGNKEKWRYRDQSNIYDRVFLLVKPQIIAGKKDGYLVGVSRFDNIARSNWLKDKKSINNVLMTDQDTTHDIYSYSIAQQSGLVDGVDHLFNIRLGDKSVNVSIRAIINAKEAFLKKIPFLMLLFGITLTLIGTLYVRNNQAQSQTLANMNKELAHKNFELNQEVSERERLNHVIQKSARENRAIINAVSDIIFELSTEGTILFLNETWKNVTGFELERSIGRNMFDLLYQQDQEQQRENFKLLVKGKKESYRAFTRVRSADGSFRAVEMAVSMLRQDENKEMRVVGTITDVEERRRAERALTEAEKKYRAIVENAAGGIYQVTPDGQFLSANPAFAKIVGYDTAEEVLRDIENAEEQLYIDAQERNKFLQSIAALGSAQNCETRIIKKNEEIIWVRETVRPVKDDDGNILFFEGSMEDIDQRRKAELALKDAKAESDIANRAKSEFLANMSHELRTPLNSVIGFSEIIKDQKFGDIKQPEYKEYAESIFDSGKKLLKVINEILDVSKIEAGERTLQESPINVQSTVLDCLELMDEKIQNNKMIVENKVVNSELSFVGEKQAVKQMFLNLLANAVKYSPPEGFLLLDAEIDSRGRLRLSVTDTGVGMNEEELAKATSPFGQVQTEHNRATSGTGLGLTLVKSLVELHGGELEIVSQKGIGTTASLIFPEKRVTLVEEFIQYENALEQHNIDGASDVQTDS